MTVFPLEETTKERQPVGVVHVVDALNIGGAERVAVNLANLLPRDRYRPYLCTTRAEGPLGYCVSPHVRRLSLYRRRRLDFGPLMRFVRFIEDNNVRIVHAHGSALFFCRLAGARSSRCALIWHDHYGRCDFNDRPTWLYRLATRRISGVIAVNQKLSNWCQADLGLPSQQVWYIPNLVEEQPMPSGGETRLDLAGVPGKRLVCVANLRPQKDHPTLLKAMALVDAAGSGAHLFLVGDSAEPEYISYVRSLITSMRLDHAVTYLGPRRDIPALLRACDIGVLSSASEGLPLALLEYGKAGLAAISTAVGQCPEVLKNGDAGLLVPARSPEDLSRAILRLLSDSVLCRTLGTNFQQHVEEHYSATCIMRQICDVYEKVIGKPV